MKNLLFSLFSIPIAFFSKAADKDSTVYYPLPDSVKVSQFLAEITVQQIATRKEVFAGIKTGWVQLSIESDKGGREIVFEFPPSARVQAKGFDTDDSEKGEIGWKYNWAINETYKLLIAVATDSAENYSLYSGYIWLPRENKWKLIGTCRIDGQWTLIQQPASFSTGSKTTMKIQMGQVWCQRSNNSWKNMKGENQPPPLVNLYSHVDSIRQRVMEMKIIEEAISSGKMETKNNKDGLYYSMIKEGTGKQVSINDTISVFYQLTLFSDGSLVAGTKDIPARFSLPRLIRGWQLGLLLCKVGGKIRLLIPSDLGYSIRTRSAKIPPNSILVFEVEVMDTKSP